MDKDYLPAVYVQFRERFPGITDKVDALGTVVDDAGPLDERTRRLVKLGIAVGAMAEGAVRSNVRKALQAGATEADVLHVVALTVTTCGFPASVAAFSWIEEVLGNQK
jgi:alkylhydroperoxidase/carboxymuconolactone decarboxylase family protein YurZ